MAIPTKYDGIEYRSRLEARWAAFMKNIGWDIVYEPFDGDGYIPDFLVQGDAPMLIEVKPAVTQKEYEAAIPKAERGLANHWWHDVLVVGASPFPQPMDGSQYHRGVNAGWLGERRPKTASADRMNAVMEALRDATGREVVAPVVPESLTEFEWGAGNWIKCGGCGGIAVYHIYWSYAGRPCSCYQGSDYLDSPPMNVMKSMWADACNDVKWRGRAA